VPNQECVAIPALEDCKTPAVVALQKAVILQNAVSRADDRPITDSSLSKWIYREIGVEEGSCHFGRDQYSQRKDTVSNSETSDDRICNAS
jgi:hypothetical protein